MSSVKIGSPGLVKARIEFFNAKVAEDGHAPENVVRPKASHDQAPIRPQKSDIPVPKLDPQLNQPVAEGAVSNYLDENGEVRMGKDKLYGASLSFEGRMNFIADAAEGCVEKFVDGGLTAQINAFEARINELGDEKTRTTCKDQLKALRDLQQAREEVVKDVRAKIKDLRDAVADVDQAPEERLKAVTAALKRLRRANRVFRYEMDAKLGSTGRDDKGGSWARRRLANFFHKIGEGISNLFDKENAAKEGERPCFDKLADASVAAKDAYTKLCGKLWQDTEVPPQSVLEGLQDFSPESVKKSGIGLNFHVVNSYIRGTLNADDDCGYSFGLVKAQLADMVRNGGHKTTEWYFGFGVGFKPCEAINLRLGIDVRYQYRIICAGDGTVTVEHLGGIAGEARMNVGLKGLLEAKGHAGAGYMGSASSITFRNIDDAARHICGGVGKLNPQFLYGGMYKIALDAVSGALPDNISDSSAFLKYLQDNKVLNKMAQNIEPGANKVLVSKADFDEFDLGIDGKVKFSPGNVVDLGVGGSAQGIRHWGVKQERKTYLASLETDFSGEAERILGADELSEEFRQDFTRQIGTGAKEAGKDLAIVNSVREIVRKEDEEVEEQEIVDNAQKLVRRFNEYVSEAKDAIAASRAELDKALATYGQRPTSQNWEKVFDCQRKLDAIYESVIGKYRSGTVLAVGLFDKWKNVAHQNLELKADYDKLSGILRTMLVNPAVELPDVHFKEGLMISAGATEDSYWTQKYTVKVGWDFIGKLNSQIFAKNDSLDDSIGANDGSSKLMAKKIVGQAGVVGGMEAANRIVGLARQSVEAEFIIRNPRSGSGWKDQVKRPWQGKRSTEINVRIGPNTPVVALIVALAHRVRAGDKKRETHLKASKVLASALVQGLLIGPGKRAFWDAWYHIMGKSGTSEALNAITNFGSLGTGSFGGGLDEMTHGKNLQIVLDSGGRVRSFSIGDHFKLDANVNGALPTGGPMIEAGFKMDSVSNHESFWIAPSFNALAEKCESYWKAGNCTEWAFFEKKNEGAFTRMGKIIASGGEKLDELDGDAKQDWEQFEQVKKEIDNAVAPKEPPDVVRRFDANRKEFEDTLKAIQGENGAVSDSDRAGLVKVLLECVARHYRLLDLAQDFKRSSQDRVSFLEGYENLLSGNADKKTLQKFEKANVAKFLGLHAVVKNGERMRANPVAQTSWVVVRNICNEIMESVPKNPKDPNAPKNRIKAVLDKIAHTADNAPVDERIANVKDLIRCIADYHKDKPNKAQQGV